MGVLKLQPQEGPQHEFLRTPADIAIYGGAAGGGKSYGLLLEPLRHYQNSKFGCVIFRKNSVQVRNEGGLWDESMSLYPFFAAHPREAALEWVFPSGARIKFSHLEYDKTVLDWQGSQIPYIGFDELTHFSEYQFFYMLSRNRSGSGVPGYVRATTNPDPDSWVRKFIDWWIGPDGYPIKERSGKIRWFLRRDDRLYWANSREELVNQFGDGPEVQPKSVTFIASNVYDNKILLGKDPAYLANLLALPKVDRLRLLGGNWNIRASAGMYFKREYFEIVDALPANYQSVMRFWDRASTKPHDGNRDPDWTRGVLLYKYANGIWIVADVRSMQDSPFEVEQLIKTTASHDSSAVAIMSQQDPGSAGKSEADHFIRMLQGYVVSVQLLSKDKVTRAKPVSAQAEARNVKVLRGPWNDDFFAELENFPEGAHDDIVDALSGAFNAQCTTGSLLDVL